MALNKTHEYKNFDASYWKIMSINFGATGNELTCELGLFKDRDARLESLKNKLERRIFNYDITEIRNVVLGKTVLEVYAYLYGKIKESKLATKLVLDGEGNPTYEQDGETLITEEVETNFFVDATDVLE